MNNLNLMMILTSARKGKRLDQQMEGRYDDDDFNKDVHCFDMSSFQSIDKVMINTDTQSPTIKSLFPLMFPLY